MVDWNNKEEVEEYIRRYRDRNKDVLKEKRKEYRIKNRFKINANTNKYYKNNKEKISKIQKKYYNNNKEEIKNRVSKRYHKNKKPITQEQREYNKAYFGNKYKNDIQFNLRVRMCNRFNQAIRKYNYEDRIVIAKDKKIDYKAIIKHLSPFPEDVSEYNIDHIIPLDFFDLTNEEHIKKAWDPVNLQFLLKSDNESKGNIIDFEKYPKQKVIWDILKLQL